MRPSPAACHPYRRLAIVLSVGLLLSVLFVACKSPIRHTSNPELRQIDELLNQQLPPGTTLAQVNFFLNTRGYPVEDAHQQHLLVATIEHVDTETLQPAAARVTFHFDANDKLTTYDLTPVTPAVH
jgi:hypothetical protein